MKREDVQAYLRRPWDEVRRSKEEYWVAEHRRMSVTEAFDLADSLRISAIALAGDAFLAERDEDLQDLIALKQKLQRVHAANRR